MFAANQVVVFGKKLLIKIAKIQPCFTKPQHFGVKPIDKNEKVIHRRGVPSSD